MTVRRRQRRLAQRAVHVADDLTQRAQPGHDRRVELRQRRHTLAHGGQNLDALDGVDAQVRVQRHARLQHLRRIACLLRDDGQHRGVEIGGRTVGARR